MLSLQQSQQWKTDINPISCSPAALGIKMVAKIKHRGNQSKVLVSQTQLELVSFDVEISEITLIYLTEHFRKLLLNSQDVLNNMA